MGKKDKNIFDRQEIDAFRLTIREKAAVEIAGGRDHDEVMVEMAQEVMHFAHRGQTLRMGGPYTNHTQFVGDHLLDPIDKQIGYMHDVLENSNITAEDLKFMGFSDEVAANIKILTKPSGLKEYIDYMGQIAPYPRACRVKLVDMCHNNHADRQSGVVLTEKRVKRLECYAIGIPYFKYLDHLRSTGSPAESIHADSVTPAIFMYETDFLQRLTPGQRKAVRDVLLELSTDNARMYWFNRAANDQDMHNRYNIDLLPGCAAA